MHMGRSAYVSVGLHGSSELAGRRADDEPRLSDGRLRRHKRKRGRRRHARRLDYPTAPRPHRTRTTLQPTTSPRAWPPTTSPSSTTASPATRYFATAPASALCARFDRDVLSTPGVTHVVVLEGINDIGTGGFNYPGISGPLPAERTAADLIAGFRQLIARARVNSLRIYGATLTPFEGACRLLTARRGSGAPRGQRMNRRSSSSSTLSSTSKRRSATISTRV